MFDKRFYVSIKTIETHEKILQRWEQTSYNSFRVAPLFHKIVLIEFYVLFYVADMEQVDWKVVISWDDAAVNKEMAGQWRRKKETGLRNFSWTSDEKKLWELLEAKVSSDF